MNTRFNEKQEKDQSPNQPVPPGKPPGEPVKEPPKPGPGPDSPKKIVEKSEASRKQESEPFPKGL